MPCQTPYRGDTSQMLLFKIASCLAEGGFVSGVSSFNGRGGVVTLLVTDVTPLIDDIYVNESGDTMTGPLNMTAGQSYQYNSVNVIRAQTAQRNYFFGPSGNLTMTGTDNLSAGDSAFISNTTGSFNVALGSSALRLNTTGFSNVAIGVQAMFSNTTGNSNTAVGVNTLFANTTGIGNSAFGLAALSINTTGFSNSAFGRASLLANSSGIGNSGFGAFTLQTNSTGSANAAFGNQALFSLASGDSNTAVGASSLLDLATPATGQNTAIGYNTGGGITTGNNNTIIGANVIGLAAALSDTIILATGTGAIRFYSNSAGLSGIATVVPNSTLHVQGSLALAYVAKVATYTVTASDYTIDCTSGTFDVDLPTAVGITGRIYVIKNSGVGTITIDPDGAELIDSLATATLVSGAAIMTQSTGTGWIII